MGKEKKQFKMPHLLWIMTGLLLVSSLCTYIIPAGAFLTGEGEGLSGAQFAYLGHQTPVSPIQALLYVLPGLVGSANVIFVVMVCGASIQVFLETKAFDRVLNYSIYKMQGTGQKLLISVLFCLMVYLGGFGGSDALIAIVPIGILFAKKLRLDPIVGMGVSTFATLIGFGTGPTKVSVTQGLMGTPIYGAFLTRFISMNIFMVTGLFMVLRYAGRISKNPEKSPMYALGWRPGADLEEADAVIKKETLDLKLFAHMVLFLGQYVVIVIYGLIGEGPDLFSVITTVMLVTAILQGIIAGMSADKIGNTFAKGLAGMAFVGFVIGIARSISMVLTDGNVLHTIVYVATEPLLLMPEWFAPMGMLLVIALINPIIPSATSKAAILVPIIQPMGEVLGLPKEMIVQAFQYGDGFTNIVSPLLAWTIGSLAMAKIPFGVWFKWAVPKVLVFIAMGCGVIFVLTVIGWTGAV